MDVLATIVMLALFGLVALVAGVESRSGFTDDAAWEHHL